MKKEAKIFICEICGKPYSSFGIGPHKWRSHGLGKDHNPNIGYENDRKIWNKGLTKYTDIRIKKIGNTFSEKIKNGTIKLIRERKFYSYSQQYRACSSFRFSLNKFKEEFDFTLIENYGWYRAINNVNNLGGVSRDHIFSVNEGIRQNLNPFLLSHPANCELMIQSKNARKYRKCNMTFIELKDKIEKWDIKYGKYFKFDIDEEWERIKSIPIIVL